MSKFLKVIAPAAGGAAGVLTMAYVLANHFVVDIPSIAPMLVSPANAASTDAADNTSAAQTRTAATHISEGGFGLGRQALPEEVAAWDIDIRPDGQGLPEGRGDVATGEAVFAEVCAVCHGDFAEGVGNWPTLAGGFDTLADKDPVKTVGSYWPYLSTVWDYVHRSMPFGNAQSLTPDEVYAITAYILYSNYLVEDDFELSHENFATLEMPNVNGFIVDDRPETEYTIWQTEPCMQACKDSVEITMRASVLDVTPEEDGAEKEAAAEPAAEDSSEKVEMAATDPEPTEAATPEADAAAAPDPELVAAGEKVFRKCKACHMVGEGAKNRVGPVLNGVMGATMGGHDDFKYSGVFEDAAAEDRVWDDAAMAEFLAAPKSYMKGTKMSFAGLKKEEDIDAIIAYLKSFGD